MSRIGKGPLRDDYFSSEIRFVGFKVIAGLDTGNMNELRNEFSSEPRIGDAPKVDPGGLI